MPTLDTPVLTVDVGLIHKVDTRNVENLFSMWTVFSRCAGSLEEGRRLENLSWRLWNRETFCCDHISESKVTNPATSASLKTSEGRHTPELPDLWSSSGSVVDEEEPDFDRVPLSRPRIRRQDSHSRSHGHERHITPDELEKMVLTIKEKKDLGPLNLSICPLPPHAEEQPVPPAPKTPTVDETPVTSLTSGQPASSDWVGGTSKSTTSVVRGFPPAQISSSLSLREQGASIGRGAQPTPQKKNPSFNEDQASLSSRTQHNGALTEAVQRPPKKQTSFREEVTTRTIHEQAFDDCVFESKNDIDESAIDDDDDSSDWVDSNEDSGHASIDEKTFFQRVDSRPNLTSRRSLITTMLHQNDRANALATAASKSTPALKRSPRASPNGPSLAASVESGDGGALMMKSGGLKSISEKPSSANTAHQSVLSPKSARRKMIQDEFTVSLRQNLLWERQQKSQTTNAVLKRRHTAHNMADLKQYPEKVHLEKDNKDADASWNEYFGTGLGEYHSKGW